MIQDLRKGMEAKIEKTQEIFIKDLEELKNKQTEMNNTSEGIHSRVTEAEETNDLKNSCAMCSLSCLVVSDSL